MITSLKREKLQSDNFVKGVKVVKKDNWDLLDKSTSAFISRAYQQALTRLSNNINVLNTLHFTAKKTDRHNIYRVYVMEMTDCWQNFTHKQCVKINKFLKLQVKSKLFLRK